MDLNPKKMRARFAELRTARDKIEAKLQPLYDEREAVRDETAKRDEALRGKIIKERAGLPEIDQEMAMISRALNGKTSEPAGIEG